MKWLLTTCLVGVLWLGTLSVYGDVAAEPPVFSSAKREFSEAKRDRISLQDFLKNMVENVKSKYESYAIQSKKEEAMNTALKAAESPNQQMSRSEFGVGILVLVLAGGVLGAVAIRSR